MLDHIDRQQRNKLKLDNLSIPSPERHRPLRHQFSSDNMHVPPFNIPNLRIDQRKTSSAEDMARKNSAGEINNLIFRGFQSSFQCFKCFMKGGQQVDAYFILFASNGFCS